MSATRAKYLQFLACYVLSGGKNPTACRKQVGLTGDPAELLQTALLHLQELQEMEEEFPTDKNARTKLEILTNISFSDVITTLQELLHTGPAKVRWEIAQVFLRNRGIQVDKQNTTHASTPPVHVFLQPKDKQQQQQQDHRKPLVRLPD